MKKCSKCKQHKELSEFVKSKTQKDGLNHYCKPCQASYREGRHRKCHLKRRYGLTLEDYERMFQAQNGFCCICKREPEQGKLLVVDHCHTTGKVRGLLCSKCNTAIGMFEDRLSSLTEAIHYLKVHSA